MPLESAGLLPSPPEGPSEPLPPEVPGAPPVPSPGLPPGWPGLSPGLSEPPSPGLSPGSLPLPGLSPSPGLVGLSPGLSPSPGSSLGESPGLSVDSSQSHLVPTRILRGVGSLMIFSEVSGSPTTAPSLSFQVLVTSFSPGAPACSSTVFPASRFGSSSMTVSYGIVAVCLSVSSVCVGAAPTRILAFFGSLVRSVLTSGSPEGLPSTIF